MLNFSKIISSKIKLIYNKKYYLLIVFDFFFKWLDWKKNVDCLERFIWVVDNICIFVMFIIMNFLFIEVI